MVYGPLGRATVTAGVYPAVGGGARSGPCCLRELLRGQALQSVRVVGWRRPVGIEGGDSAWRERRRGSGYMGRETSQARARSMAEADKDPTDPRSDVPCRARLCLIRRSES